MIKKIFAFLSTMLMLANNGFASDIAMAVSAAPLDLSWANQKFMALMLGSKGINDTRGTDIQLRQMIDGAITTGVTDRLYNFGDRLGTFKAQVATLSGKKKLHVQLAYAFYALGYYAPHDIGMLKQRVLPLCGNLEPHFDGEFAKLCALVYSKGDIFVYKNLLEDVIKRTTSPLRVADFVRPQAADAAIASPPPPPPLGSAPVRRGGPPPPPPLPMQGDDAPRVERYYTDAELAGLDVGVIEPYKKLREKGTPPKLARMQGQLPAKYVGDAVTGSPLSPPPPPPPVVQGDDAQRVERYYTDAELAEAGLDAGQVERYKIIRRQPGKSPKAARMPVGLFAKYEEVGATLPAVSAPQAAPSRLLADLMNASPQSRLKKTQTAAATPATPPAIQNPMMLQLQQQIAKRTLQRQDSSSSEDGGDW